MVILCFHGIARRDEHLWRPYLFVSPETFRRRMQILNNGGYHVLPLGEAVARLGQGTLPSQAVVITFDDGFSDFYSHAFPILRHFGFPCTVYLTTYYAARPLPVFNLMTHYLLWRNRGTSHSGVSARLGGRLDLDTPDLITRAWHKINEYAEDADLDVNEKDALASDLATALGEDYAELKRSRLLQIMNREELEAVCAAGVDIQLHTHRHRSPNSRELYMQELTDNQQRIIELTGCRAVHFCYPSGVYSPDFVSWLKELGVQSATTCDAGLVDIRTSLLLLPRVLDSEALSDLEFEGWVSGFWPALRH